MKRSTIAAGALLAALGAGIAVRLRWPPKAPRVGPVAAAPAARFAGRLGEQLRYRLAFRLSLSQEHDARPIEVTLDGEWVTTVVAARPGEYDVACEVAGARVGGGSEVQPAAEAMEALRRRFERRFWVTYRDDGVALGVHFPKDVAPGDRNLLQMIPTETQLVLPAGGAPRWTALERDGAGVYLAAYQRVDPSHVVKRKLKYTDVESAGAAAEALTIDLDTSERRYTLDGAGHVLAFEGSDRVRITMALGPGGQLGVRSSTRLSDGRLASAPELVGSLAGQRADVDDAPIRAHEVDPQVLRKERDQRLLEGRSTEALLDAAVATGAGADPLLPSRLAALFRERPEAIAAAVTRVRERPAARSIIEALATAGTAPALEALSSLAHDASIPAGSRINVLSSLALLAHPSANAMRVPADLYDDADPKLRQAARLIGGALASAGRADLPAEAESIDRALIERYRRATALPEREELIGALGNSVGPTVLPVLADALHDARPELRVAAARALRLAEGPDTDRQLIEALTSDRDPRVRAAAIFAAGFRSFDPYLDALARAATDDPIDYVRSASVGLLKQHLVVSPKIRGVLERVAGHDPKPAVRRLASEALAAPR